MRTADDQGSAGLDVTCATCREALSAQLDGEPAPVETSLHLARCAQCAAWARDVPSLLRPLRMRAADDVPDLTERILSAILGSVPRPSFGLSLARAALMAVAIAQLVVGVLLLLGSSHDEGLHAAAESGAWNIAIGLGLATAALRPHAAFALLPTIGGLVAVLGYASVRDLADGAVSVQRVLSHALVALGLLLVAVVAWLMRRRRGWRPVPAAEPSASARLGGLMPR
ncbi:hypothetical protein [Cumulibacter manganitolerans]|uniref:hypothetical protein n=1 Tax=Cumulibacter manganitolerans TaxID=1884992 RepID=UPI001296146B|nr:hypothetical protein [Cumulibacter manganitolerans]